ncbi:MAG: metal-sensitive transcriptional regulator [Candidatus Peribacteraceae bacterium]|nr:metal-sensitive transcriptional regulator [Candidatus Peribacteraceae bacterium]
MATVSLNDVQKRLKNIQGQLDGIQRMIGESKDCFDVLPQLKAAKAGLERCIALYLQQQAAACMSNRMPADSQEKMLGLIKELTRF